MMKKVAENVILIMSGGVGQRFGSTDFGLYGVRDN